MAAAAAGLRNVARVISAFVGLDRCTIPNDASLPFVAHKSVLYGRQCGGRGGVAGLSTSVTRLPQQVLPEQRTSVAQGHLALVVHRRSGAHR